jgi:predicted chitinase
MHSGGKIAYPFLEIKDPVEWEDGDFGQPAKVANHEGRNRMTQWIKLKGDDPIQVNIFLRGANRRRYITDDMIQSLSQGLVSQSGQLIKNPFDASTALEETRWNGSALYRHLVELENDKGVSNSTTLANLYNGNYPDRDETFWDYVNSSDFNKSIAIQTLPKHKVMIMLLGQYRAEHIDDVMDMLDDDRKELVQSYIDDPALSSKVIVILGNRIIDGNHRALAAAIKGSPINYVDLADLDDEVDEGVVDWAKKSAVAGAMALGALGSGQADAKPLQPTMKSAIAQPANDTSGHNVLSNNPDHEIVVLKAAKKAGFKGAELAQFMAQTKHESWDFARLKEKPQPGVKGYFAKKYDPKLAPKTAKILGNKKVGDGEKYHGRGFIQLTGRDNYRMAQQALGLPLLNNPDMAANPEVAAKIAIWYWNTRVKPNIRYFADTATVTKYINPAARGLENRNENFKDYMRII